MVKRILHVGIATHSIAVVSEFYRLLGLRSERTEVLKDDRVKVAMMSVGDASIELIEPTDDKSPVASFLEKRGEGIHHISLEVDDLDATLERLKKMNVQLIDKDPRGGAGGRRIAFIHPHSTGGVLVELCEALPEG
ncbi:MAG: methylmalonyl-CoA epimerase [Acidobacteriota bacterium]